MTVEIVTVRNSTELSAAVDRLAAGEGGTVLLEAGVYSLDSVDKGEQEIDAPVRITSADPANPATFTKMRLLRRENVTVDNVEFDARDLDPEGYFVQLEVNASRGVVFADSTFVGAATETLDGTPGQHKAVDWATVRFSEDVVLRDLHVSGYNHGVALMDSGDVTLTGNEITRMQGDGIRIAGVQDLLIEGNHLHSMLGTSQDINHSDMIQFWGTNIQRNTERVTIRDNVINSTDGPSYQMIFGRNEHRSKNGWLFEDITIEGNLLHGATHNQIALSDTDGLVVRNNTVLWNSDTHVVLRGGAEGSSEMGSVRIVNSRDTTIENNVAGRFADGAAGNGLVRYDDPSSANHHAKHFVNLEAGSTADLRDLSLRPDSEWDGVMGAPMTWSDHAAEALTAVATVARVAGDESRVVLDAGLSRDESGRLGADDATFTWVFADGTRREGVRLEHDFVSPGEHGYTLEVRTADGRTDRIERKVGVADPDLLAIDMSGDEVRDASDYGSKIVAEDPSVEDGGFRLDGSSSFAVSRWSPQIFSLDSFALEIEFRPDAGTTGTLVELYRSFEGFVDASGRFVFDIQTTDGEYRVRSDKGAVSGGEPVTLGVVLDGEAGELRVLVDGEVQGTVEASGSTKAREYYNLVFGNLFGGHSARGVIEGVKLRAEPRFEDEGIQMVDSATDSAGPDLADEHLLASVDFDEAVADASAHGTRIERDEAELRFEAGSDGTGRSVALGDAGDGVVLSRGNAHLFELDAFHVAFDLRREDASDGGGRILSLHNTLELRMDDAGRLVFDLATDGGQATAATAAPVLTDGGWHTIEMAYDGERGLMQLVLDDEVVADAALTGTTAGASYWGLSLGRLWGGEAEAFIDDLRIWDEAQLRGATEAGGSELSTLSDVSTEEADVLAAFEFDGNLSEAGQRRVGVWAADGVSFGEGRDEGQAVRIGDGAAVAITRDNAFIHERDAFALSFDLRKDDAAGEGRVIHFNKAMEARVVDGEFVFSLRTDEGTYEVATTGGAMDDADWHAVEIGYDDAAGRLTLDVDGAEASTEASGTTAEALYWGLTLGAAWGDALEGSVDHFVMSAAPDWAMA